jgi:hypothetical protein
MLIHLYSANKKQDEGKQPMKDGNRDRPLPPLPNGHARGSHSGGDRRLRDVQEFELEALMDEDDEYDSSKPGAPPV